MQKKANAQKPIELIYKPIIPGSWHGKDARKLAFKRVLSVLAISFIYLLAGAFLSFESLWLRMAIAVLIVFTVTYYQWASGVSQGQSDATYGEILYNRRESGKEISKEDADRSFHRFKGLYAVALALIPFVLFTLVFACLTKPTTYHLGVLPAWTESMMTQTEFGSALAYYHNQPGLGAMDVMRIIVRAMIMPFMNVAAGMGSGAALTAERLSPLFVMIAPLGYGLGYMQGLVARAKINTGIKMGDDKKKRREIKKRKQRQRSKSPERLI